MIYAGETVALSPSGDTTGAADAAAVSAAQAALPAAGGVVRLAATGKWNIKCGQITVNRSGVYIDAEGCYINAVGSGDMIRMYDSSTYSSRTLTGGGLLGNPVIDGTATAGAATAIHFGDIFHGTVRCSPQNFTQPGSDGVLFDNTYYWTERLDADITATNCYRHVRFSQNPAVPASPTCTGSFDRGDLKIYVNQTNAAFDGIVFEKGTYPIGSFCRWWGNFSSSSSALTSAAIRVAGTTPAGSADPSTPSNIFQCLWNVNMECASGAHTPNLINVDSGSGCSISSINGVANFAAGGANFNGWVGPVAFWGLSDTLPSQTTQTNLLEGLTGVGSYASTSPLASSGTISSSVTWAPVSTTGNVTGVIVAAGNQDGQLLYVVNTTAFTITMAASGTSHVADGTSDVIPASTARCYVWSVNASLWFRAA